MNSAIFPILSFVAVSLTVPRACGDGLSFDRDVRPILSDKCFHCHGFDEKKREAGLRLDTREGATADLGGYAAIVPGQPDASELVHRVFSRERDEIMPPPSSKIELSGREKEILREWIAGGAEYERHWSFRPPEKPGVPEGSHPVDFFIESRLEKASLSLNPPADPRTLARRMALDLTGLPPSPERIADFVRAYRANPERAVGDYLDELFASRHFGERLAWEWLDVARYADTNGYQGDRERTAWPWRDWVVEAFRKNLPFDRFTLWQLAGDLLPEATPEQILATGFNRNHPINGEGGRIPEENRVEYVFDMTETMGTAWLGLTLECCRCHDHKFDPLSQRDYFSLTAFFNQTPVTGGGGDPQTKPVLPVPDERQQAELDERLTEQAELDRAIEARSRELLPSQAKWEKDILRRHPDGVGWERLIPSSVKARKQSLQIGKDGAVLAGGPVVDRDTYEVAVPIAGRRTISAVRLEALSHQSHTPPGKGLSRASSGNFVLTGFEFRAGGEPRRFASATATFEQGGHPVKQAIDNDPGSGWAVYPGKPVTRPHHAVFVLEKAVEVKAGEILTFTLRHDSPYHAHNLGRFRLSITGAKSPKAGAEEAWVTGIRKPPEQRDAAEKTSIREAFLRTDGEFRKLEARRAQGAKKIENLRKAIPRVMVMADREDRRPTHILNAGLYDQPGEEVNAAIPAVFEFPSPDKTPSRLDLAQWIVDPENPLTARVIVNRHWQMIFGTGLVATPEDFGSQGERPSHPELLDWLAGYYVGNGWDTRDLLRLLLTSRTYRQGAAVDPEKLERDPGNRLLSRSPRNRLPSWMLRDQALAVSGLLNARIGGPPVKPYQPEGVWQEATFGKKTYQPDSGDRLYRRTLYTFWRRIVGPTMLFDSAKRLTCEVRPTRTNTPLHALTTLNETLYVEAARNLAQSVLLERRGGESPIRDAFRGVVLREPDEEEAALLESRFRELQRHYHAHPADAAALIAVGDSKAVPSLDPADLAAATALVNALMNLDEVLCRP